MSRIDLGGRLVPYPEPEVARWRAQGLWGTATIASEFRAVADRFPNHDAVVTAQGRLTYAELDRSADRLAVGFVGAGLMPGDRVVLQLSNRMETVQIWYGLLKAGLIPVCSLAAHRSREIAGVSRHTDAVAHLVEGDLGSFDLVSFAEEMREGHPTLRRLLTIGAPASPGRIRIEDLLGDESVDADGARTMVDDIQAGIDPDEVVVFQLSGGTTGVPKVIPRLHAEYWYNARAYAERNLWDDTTRTAHLIPIVHNAGIVCGVHGPHTVGGCLILTTADLTQAMPLLVAEKATDALLGHAHFPAIMRPEFAALAHSLRRVILSGAKVPLPIFAELERLGVWTGQLFGMGEGFFTLSSPTSSRDARLATVGTPLSPEDRMKVLAPDTEDEVPDGEPGELVCAGPYTLRGYFGAPELQATAFTSDGFYRTGDLVSIRAFGDERCLSVEGRIKDLISRGGEKISAEEVEVLLMQHPGIAAVALVAMPDARLGERACAYLVATGAELTLTDIQDHLQDLGVAKFKWPERLEWVRELPRTPVGKLNKKLLQSHISAKIAAELAT